MILISIWKVSAEPVTVVCIHKLPHHMWRAQVFCGNIDCQLPILPATNFLGGKTQRGLGGGDFGQEVGRALREKLRKWKLTAVYPPFTSFSMGVGLAVVGVSRDSVDHRMLAPSSSSSSTDLVFPGAGMQSASKSLHPAMPVLNIAHSHNSTSNIFCVLCSVLFCAASLRAQNHKIALEAEKMCA